MHNMIGMLDNVKFYGGRHHADCPSCGKKRKLSVKEGDKGLLVKCWSGCSTDEICGSLGMRVHELFYEDLPMDQRRPVCNFDIELEKHILLVAVSDNRNGKPVAGADRERATLAMQRLKSISKYNEVMEAIR